MCSLACAERWLIFGYRGQALGKAEAGLRGPHILLPTPREGCLITMVRPPSRGPAHLEEETRWKAVTLDRSAPRCTKAAAVATEASVS